MQPETNLASHGPNCGGEPVPRPRRPIEKLSFSIKPQLIALAFPQFSRKRNLLSAMPLNVCF